MLGILGGGSVFSVMGEFLYNVMFHFEIKPDGEI